MYPVLCLRLYSEAELGKLERGGCILPVTAPEKLLMFHSAFLPRSKLEDLF